MDVRVGAEFVPIGGPKQRVFLVALLTQVNRPVSLAWLTEAIWDGDPPASAIANLRNYAMSTRRWIRHLTEAQLTTLGGTYRITAGWQQLDLTRFERLAAEGRAALAIGDHRAGVHHLAEAVALHRGPVGQGLVYGRPLAARLAALDELRLSVIEELTGAELSVGRYADAVVRLRLMLGEAPLRERYWALLVRALYCMGDIAGSLNAFDEARSHLVELLGVDPGPDLQNLHSAILRRDPRLCCRTPHSAATPIE